ncbi:MAG TPA: hypothetical protein PKM73_00680 [Verrucomicrobiota bacterium]|nr:hypothetical protein [Verrucomicrobiota bacterium]HNU49857.1 hypothetical protein [Verrucomicrobiota bacterium]
MKTLKLTPSILAAVLLAGSIVSALAQSAPPARECPFGHPPGYGRNLTPEQRAEQRAAMQQTIDTLRQKLANGTLSPEEEAWLKNAQQRGGPCINGVPRGRGAGKGPGAANGNGQGRRFRQGLGDGTGPGPRPDAAPGRGYGRGFRQGPRDGTGPRALDGACPNAPELPPAQ